MKGRKEKAPYHAWGTEWGLSPSTSWQSLSVQIFPGARISPKAETHIHLQMWDPMSVPAGSQCHQLKAGESKHACKAAGGEKRRICRMGMRLEWDQSLEPSKESGEERQTQTHSSKPGAGAMKPSNDNIHLWKQGDLSPAKLMDACTAILHTQEYLNYKTLLGHPGSKGIAQKWFGIGLRLSSSGSL